MTMNCIILDDEPKAIEVLERYIEKIPFLTLSASFRDPIDAIGFMNENKTDLLFLDINMPGLSGLKVPSMINKHTGIIFTTAYPEHAIDGFELNAIDYLLKPVTFERFLKAVTKANEQYVLKIQYKDLEHAFLPSTDKEAFFLKSGTQIHRISVEDILYFEKESVYFLIHLVSGKKLIIRTNFAGLIEILPRGKFIRVHKSYIIALKHIEVINKEEVIIKKVAIPISETYKEEFMNLIKKNRSLNDI